MNDLVSIIMPAYNSGLYIKESINSVLNQTYGNWELIIIDDGSSDDTIKIIDSYSDSRIKLIKNIGNRGAAESRNHGLRVAHGRWIAFLDSDDLWECHKLEKQIEFMISNNYSFSYTNYHKIENDGKICSLISGPRKINKFLMKLYCWPGCLTVMYDSYVSGKIEIFPIKKNNDYAMWLKIIKKSDCYLLREDLASYRRHQGSISNVPFYILLKWHYRLFRDCEEESACVALLHTMGNIFFGVIKKLFFERKVKQE